MKPMGKIACAGIVLGGLCVLQASEAEAGSHEVMMDRCSGEVAFAPTYGANPTAQGTVVLKRGKNGYSPWTTFSRHTGDDGHVRWWCHSTTGNLFDPGTWRVHVNNGALKACLMSIENPVSGDSPSACVKTLELGTSAFEGWTPERSRCGDHSTKFRARLGPDRLLETECLGK